MGLLLWCRRALLTRRGRGDVTSVPTSQITETDYRTVAGKRSGDAQEAYHNGVRGSESLRIPVCRGINLELQRIHVL